jgi:aspartyl-tRNA(Asn)/glutamyl-tRNA(Gln) amidotransferase subunit B
VTWETVVGLEVHAQLLTKTKIFCGCETSFGAAPNTHVCPVCLGLPGALPVLNEAAVRLAVRVGLALGCALRGRSIFARKNYFYPDLPKGYQISQFEEPYAEHGSLEIAGRRIRILRVHMEEDAGKLFHQGDVSIVDLNRAGTPLVEIVGEPDLRSGAEAAEYLRELRDILVFLGVCDGNLEEGSFRCDANVSVRKPGEQLGTRVELKNINSFRFVQRAIEHEAARQEAALESGGKISAETRGWDEKTGTTYPMRSKETAQDYRYFPEPDLPPLVVDESLIALVKSEMPELPRQKRARWIEGGVSEQAAEVLTGHPRIAAFFEETALLFGDLVKVANFVQAEVLRDTKTHGLHADLPVTPKQVAGILDLVRKQTISGKQAKDLYAKIARTDRDPAQVAKELGLSQVTDAGAIEAACKKVISENPKQAEAVKAGKKQVLGFLVGQVMKETGGRANPALVSSTLEKLLA